MQFGIFVGVQRIVQGACVGGPVVGFVIEEGWGCTRIHGWLGSYVGSVSGVAEQKERGGGVGEVWEWLAVRRVCAVVGHIVG